MMEVAQICAWRKTSEFGFLSKQNIKRMNQKNIYVGLRKVLFLCTIKMAGFQSEFQVHERCVK